MTQSHSPAEPGKVSNTQSDTPVSDTRNDYGSEEMAADIADAVTAVTNAEIGETFRYGAGHAFNITTPREHKFLVTVTRVQS